MIIKHILLILIRIYQVVLSPLLGPACRYYPSCSVYAQEAIKEHGTVKGVFLSIKRVLRCNPLFPGGFDPVPEGRIIVSNKHRISRQ